MGLNTGEVMFRLRERYKAPEYAFLPEVCDQTGTYWRRKADGIAMSLYPSRGIFLHGFEVKVSRSDWIKELKDPAKADVICRFCDFWWVVVGSDDIVQDGELPPTWGLLIPNGEGIRVKVQAPKLECVSLEKPFVASILRRVTENLTSEAVIEQVKREARSEGFKQGEKAGQYRIDEAQRKYDHLNDRVRAFEEASGVSIERGWTDAAKIGEAVRVVLNGEHTRLKDKLNTLKRVAQSIVETCDTAMKDEAA